MKWELFQEIVNQQLLGCTLPRVIYNCQEIVNQQLLGCTLPRVIYNCQDIVNQQLLGCTLPRVIYNCQESDILVTWLLTYSSVSPSPSLDDDNPNVTVSAVSSSMGGTNTLSVCEGGAGRANITGCVLSVLSSLSPFIMLNTNFNNVLK